MAEQEETHRIGMVIYFEHTDVNKAQPWPIAVDPDGLVQSGLGNDDGSRLLGFGPKNVQAVDVRWQVAALAPDSVIGLVPTFAAPDGTGLFLWNIPIARIEIREL